MTNSPTRSSGTAASETKNSQKSAVQGLQQKTLKIKVPYVQQEQYWQQPKAPSAQGTPQCLKWKRLHQGSRAPQAQPPHLAATGKESELLSALRL